MKKHFPSFFALLITLMIAQSCGTTLRLYRFDDEARIFAGQLSDATLTALKLYLTNTTSSRLKDTIIIKYDYNNETCWNTLDQRKDAEILGFVTKHQERLQQVLASRQNVSIFDFREPGNNLNKIKKWDNSIIIDGSKQLFNLLFKERCTCGNSIIIMPDKKFIFLRSDSHSEILDLTQKQLEQILAKN